MVDVSSNARVSVAVGTILSILDDLDLDEALAVYERLGWGEPTE